MSKANTNGAVVNQSDSAPMDDVATVPTTQPDNHPTDDQTVAANEASLSRIVNLVVATIDPTDALAKYETIGRECLAHLKRMKASVKGKWIKSDYDRFCTRVADEVKQRVAIDRVETATYIKTCLFLDAIRPHVPAVDSVSYHRIKNVYLGLAIEFDPTELTGGIRLDWTAFVVDRIAADAGAEPPTIVEAKQAVAEHSKSLADAKLGKLTPEKQAEKVAKERESKIRAEKTKHRNAIDTALRDAIETRVLTPLDIAQQLDAVCRDTEIVLPTVGAFNPATATPNDVLALADGLFKAGKIVEIKTLHGVLGKMLEAFASSVAAPKSAEKAEKSAPQLVGVA